MKKVLIITYYWPPSGGPGVQRVLKLVKYLQDFGWEPIVLTVNNGEFPATDETLVQDIPNDCKVFKSKAINPVQFYRKFTGMKSEDVIPVGILAKKDISKRKKISNWIRLNFFIPDAKVGWIPSAVKEGKRILKKENPDIIFSTSPPPSVHLIARKLAKWSGIRWVADFRDPWTKIHYLHDKKLFSFSRKYNERLEQSVIHKCDKAICVSNSFIKLLSENALHKFEVITNGFDDADKVKPVKDTEHFTITYIGGLHWNRYYEVFFEKLSKLVKQGEIDKNKLIIQIAGSIDDDIKVKIETVLDDCGRLIFDSYISHNEAIKLMKQSDLLLLFLDNVPNYEGHIPGKLFEYLTVKNPVICIGNKQGEASEILERTGVGKAFDPNDQKEIEQELIKHYNNWKHCIPLNYNDDEINAYSRKKLAGKFAAIFDSLLLNSLSH